MRSRAPRFFFAFLIGVPLAVACGAQDVSIPDSVLPDAGGGGDASDSGTTGDGPGITDGNADAADVTCADVLPDDNTGIYVTPTGANSGTCGSRAAPCKTLTFSVTRAGAALRSKVYAAQGTYVEKVTLAAGVEVIGGWAVTGTTWKRACVTPEQLVVVRAPVLQNVTVEARDLGGEARLSMLRIESKAPASVLAGESLYGVVAVGSTTVLTLTDVDIELGAAGTGADGTKGTPGVAGAISCPAGGTGVPGTPGTGGSGALAGSFDPAAEYTPGVATAGNADAVAGGDGTPVGGAGTCVTCGSCGATLCDFIPDPIAAPACGKTGTTGCGGGPGGPGGPATGGGSSVGLFAWDASVTVNGGKVKSGDGGNGGAGGAGGGGGVATKGAVGAPSDLCTTSCVLNAGVCTEMKSRGLGGTAGGSGAVGGVGGAGGGGGGGSSFAIYQGGAGVVSTASGAALAHGKAGKGGLPAAGMGAAGAAADRVP